MGPIESDGASMKSKELVQELERIAKQLGIKVSYEPATGMIAGTGGLCRVRGEYRLIIDRRLKPGARAQVLADALARFDTERIEVPTAIATLLRPRAPEHAPA